MHREWITLDSSLTSALFHLMRLPTVNHIELSFIPDFPLASFTPSVNLLRFDILFCLCPGEFEDVDVLEVVVQSMPRIREFRTSRSALLTSRLLHAKREDGQPVIDFTELRRLSICLNDEENIRYLLQNAKLLEILHLSVENHQDLVGIHDILFTSAPTLKVIDMTISCDNFGLPPLAVLCEELEAMAGNNVLETLSFKIPLGGDETGDSVGSAVQNVAKILVNPGWSRLRQVSFKISIPCCRDISWVDSAELFEALQTLPDKYLSHPPKPKSFNTFNYSTYVAKCAFGIH